MFVWCQRNRKYQTILPDLVVYKQLISFQSDGTMADSDPDSDYVSDTATEILSDSEPEEEPVPFPPPGIPRLVRQNAIVLRQPLIMVRREKGG